MSGAQLGRKIGHVFLAVLALSLTTSCGPKRERKQLSRNSSELKFAGGISPAQAAIQPQQVYSLAPLFGTYEGTLISNNSQSAMQFELTSEEVHVIEDEKDYTFAKIIVRSAQLELSSYLSVQQGTVSGMPALAFSSTPLSNPMIAANPFAIYLILATQNGQFLSTLSSIYLLDCGLTPNGTCSSSTPVSTARFGAGLMKRQ